MGTLITTRVGDLPIIRKQTADSNNRIGGLLFIIVFFTCLLLASLQPDAPIADKSFRSRDSKADGLVVPIHEKNGISGTGVILCIHGRRIICTKKNSLVISELSFGWFPSADKIRRNNERMMSTLFNQGA